MTAQHKTMTWFGLAALAAGFLVSAQPATAAGLTHAAAFTRTNVVADHNDWNNGDHNDRHDFGRQQNFRRDQILRRQEEFRREQEIRRAEFRREQDRHHDDHRDSNHDSNRDRHNDNNRDFRDNR